MLNVKQTSPNKENRFDYYRVVYPMQEDQIIDLIDISSFNGPIIAVDCCGWHYEKIFQHKVIKLELLTTAKQYGLERNQFDRLIDDQDDMKIVLPKLNVDKPCIILDRSVIMRYRSIQEIMLFLDDIIRTYKPKDIIIRGLLQFIDDNRLCDRFYNWTQFVISGYVISKFVYDTEKGTYNIQLRRKK